MKTSLSRLLIALLATLAAMTDSSTAKAQGAIFLNDYDSGMGIFFQNGATLTAAIAGTEVQVLSGTSPNSLTPVFNASPSSTDVFLVGSGDVAANPDGGSAFDGGYGYSSIPAFGVGWIEIVGSVTVAGVGYAGSVEWQQSVGGPQPPDSSLPTIVSLVEPIALILQPIPEPPTIDSVALIGLLSLFRLPFLRIKLIPIRSRSNPL
jgi:hypothetical protein